MNQTPPVVSADNYSKIIKALKEGKVVALPTETVFGLAVSLNSAAGLEKLIYLKRRDIKSGKVFTLVPEEKEKIETYALLGRRAKELIAKFVPGEITLILNKNPDFSHPYFNNFNTIGIRIPKHPLFARILEETGPLFLTSANERGKPPLDSSAEVEKFLKKVDLIVEGKAGGNPPSTIVDLTKKSPKILRAGRLKLEKD